MRRLSLVLVALLVAAPACDGATEPGATPSVRPPLSTIPSLFDHGTARIEVQDATVTLDVEIADSEEAHRRGLMFRTSLPEDAGMVFLFTDEVPRRFWMKDTTIPLSIAFFSSDGTIVSMADMAPCPAEPCPFYESGLPAQGALEVNQGFFERHGIRLNHVITVERD